MESSCCDQCPLLHINIKCSARTPEYVLTCVTFHKYVPFSLFQEISGKISGKYVTRNLEKSLALKMDVFYLVAIKSLLLLAIVRKSVAGKIFLALNVALNIVLKLLREYKEENFLHCVSTMHSYRDCTVIQKFQLLCISLGSEHQKNCRCLVSCSAFLMDINFHAYCSNFKKYLLPVT